VLWHPFIHPVDFSDQWSELTLDDRQVALIAKVKDRGRVRPNEVV
jgi:hypothetical protein